MRAAKPLLFLGSGWCHLLKYRELLELVHSLRYGHKGTNSICALRPPGSRQLLHHLFTVLV